MKKALAVLGMAVTAAAAVMSLVASGAAAPALPRACTLLKRTEAAAIVGVKVQPAVDGGSLCTYNGYPTGPAAQVTVFVTSGVPRTLKIDRSLHHRFRRVPRLGDEAGEELWAIFVRKGGTWVMISVVRSDDWTRYRKPIERAAAIAISRLKARKSGSSSGGGKSPGSSSSTPRGTRVVGHLPPGGGTNSLWRGSQRRFGGSVGHYPGVTYQPDVVVIGGGANAVRAESADALTWTLAGTAPGVRDLRVGKIMLATTFASGRVLALAKAGPNVRVTLGPASLTQIVRDGVFDSKGPVALQQPLFYSATLPSSGQRAKRRIQSVSSTSGTGALFGTLPICCAGSVGVHLSYDNGSGRLKAALQLGLEKPTVDFHIRIGGGKLLEANLALHGGAALHFSFFGATTSVSGNIRSGPLLVPGSITIPIGGPLSLQFSQRFDVSMQLAGAAWMKSSADYRLSGTLGFGTSGAGFRPDPVAVTVANPIIGNTASQGIGSNAFSLGWTLRATVGIGAGGLSAGAWYELKPGFAVVMDGMPGSLKQGCVSAAVAVLGKYGVGYTIPAWVADAVNAVLGAVGAKPIATSGGPSSKDYVIWKPPAAEACPKQPGS